MQAVDAVLVSWNSMAWLPGALRSLESQTRAPAEIVVVDNDSRDGVAEYLAREHPRVRLIRNHGNLGFAHAVNQGIHATRSEWLLVMNPDVQLEPTYLERLLAAAARLPDAGALGGLLTRPDGAIDSA